MRNILDKVLAMRRHLISPAAITAAAGLLLAGCGTTSGSASTTTTPAGATVEGTSRATGSTADAATSRITLTYDGGLLVLDAATLQVEGDLKLGGFNRINPAGDGRHVMVSTDGGFRVLDTGTSAAEPALTDLTFPAEEPGHVVRHADRTVLFDDGTGDITAFDTDALLTATAVPPTQRFTSESAHHGVAIELSDGTVVSTLGTPDKRTGARHLDAAGTEIARNEQCPGIHGEGTLKDEVVVFGCQDGVLVFRDGTFTKVDAPDEFGRTGNAYVTDTSSVLVGDYRDDPDAEGYLLHRLALLDTADSAGLRVLDLPNGVEYTWRDVARGPSDEALLLGTDGALHSIDPVAGQITASWPLIDGWIGPAEWQNPHPALVVNGDVAYVTDPSTSRILAVDVTTGKVLAQKTLPAVPNEIAVTTGV